ncbi:hypothetical protein LCGC14_1712830 [marine sediment metagenome]|uniref:Uncharacterized protein n=1 Tax=marine sediment metagenome TaxID=412755 RepID=A0A0F9JV62_9ZZZZ
MAFINDSRKPSGVGQVITAGVLLAATPVVSSVIDVQTRKKLGLRFDLTRVAATSVIWHLLGSTNGTDFSRVPSNRDDGTPPNTTMLDGNFQRTGIGADDDWFHDEIDVASLRAVQVVVDSVAGTTDTVDVDAYAE